MKAQLKPLIDLMEHPQGRLSKRKISKIKSKNEKLAAKPQLLNPPRPSKLSDKRRDRALARVQDRSPLIVEEILKRIRVR